MPTKPRSVSKSAKPGKDVALLCGQTEDGQGVNIIRKRGSRLEAGVVRPLSEGQPLQGEVVRLTPRPGAPRICDVDVEYDPTTFGRAAAGASDARRGGDGERPHGPAQVASERYRKNWDAIWKRTRQKRVLN